VRLFHTRTQYVLILYREAACRRCDVCNWDDQIDLFVLAMTRFEAVDVVV
jgi:hypothetical protein